MYTRVPRLKNTAVVCTRGGESEVFICEECYFDCLSAEL